MSWRVIIGGLVACVALGACGDDGNDRSSLPLLANRVAASSDGEITTGDDAGDDAGDDTESDTGDTGDTGDGPSTTGETTAAVESGVSAPPTDSTATPGGERAEGATPATVAGTTTTVRGVTTTTAPTPVTPTTTGVAPTTTVAGRPSTTTSTTPTSTTSTTTTTTTTTSTTLPPPIPGGRYRVPDEVAYGVYRAGPYWATLDAEDVTINSDIVDVCLSVMVVDERASFVEIEGEARRVEAIPTYDPIAAGCTNGTYLVGPDLAPGRYRLVPINGFAYWARLDRTLEVIDSDLVEEEATITIAAGDFALSYTGTLQRLG